MSDPTGFPLHRSGDGPADDLDAAAASAGPAAGGVDLELSRDRRQPAAVTATAEPDTDAVVYEGEVVLVDQHLPAPDVDLLAELRARAARRRPIVPPWARRPGELRAVLRWLAGHYLHTGLYHLTRLPKYVAKLLARAPAGLIRTTVAGFRWVWDWEGLPVRLAAVRREDAEQYLKLSRLRDARVRLRVFAALCLTALALAAVAAVLLAAPGWVRWAAAAVVVTILGLVGSPADRPLLDTAVVPYRVQRLTSEVVVRALGALGIAGINQALARGVGAVTFPAPITRDGPGWRADIDLPYGVTVTDIIERRDRLASGLRRPLGCVWPEPAHEEHAGRLVLWVGDQDMSAARTAPWPLARSGRADLFRPVPFGTDQRGRLVQVPLMFGNVLIGAMPRFGKTMALRLLLLAAALDVTAELRVFELKGTGDLSALEKVAHHYASGVDDATIEACLVSLREVHADLERRAKVIAGLPRHVCPENKVTPELSARTSLGLHPLVLSVDECQELFSHPVFGREAGELWTAVIKRGPALGIIGLLATQRPDKDSLPTGVSANVGIRFCLRVMGQVENDMVLGTSSYRNGIRATTFGPRDKGIGYLVGAADDPQIVRTAYLDAPAADKVADRARAARAAAGTLSGHATGQPIDTGPGYDLLDDLLSVIAADETKVWSETVVARLATLRPQVYGGWEPEQLAAALRPFGVRTGQVWGSTGDGRGANRRGITRADLQAAVTERNRRRGVGPPGDRR